MKRVAIVVGHTPFDGGAHNAAFDISEYDFNSDLSVMIATEVRKQGYVPWILFRDTYTVLPDNVNSTNADLCISLHCNAFDTQTAGCEVLHWYGSVNGKQLATSLSANISATLGNNNRGAKPIDYDTDPNLNDAGGWLVEKTSMPCVILESFFIDNDDELTNAMGKKEELAVTIATAIHDYLG